MRRPTRRRRCPGPTWPPGPAASPWTGRAIALVPAPRHPAAPAAEASRPRGLETLSRLADKLAGSDSALVVDAETAGRVLGVTARTARRLLHSLVEEGLAWPLPPSRAPQPGRPRQFYRLVTEKLERRRAAR